jgi:hypothetical protein
VHEKEEEITGMLDQSRSAIVVKEAAVVKKAAEEATAAKAAE